MNDVNHNNIHNIFYNIQYSTNNELIQVVRILNSLSKWLGVRLLTPTCEKNSVERNEPTLYVHKCFYGVETSYLYHAKTKKKIDRQYYPYKKIY
jgi:hypothetical protein